MIDVASSVSTAGKACGSYQVIPTGGALGADIVGIDLEQVVSAEAFEGILDAWCDHLVLRIRGQKNLSPEGLVAFSRHFGELDRAPITVYTGNPYIDDCPELTVISNIIEGGKPIGGLANYEAEWHTDMSYNEVPPCASILHAIEVPETGGDTGFCNMYLAYETLPREEAKKLEGLVCRHDSSRNSAGQLRKGAEEVADPRKTPGAKHPLVRTHPLTKRKALFLGRRRNAYIEGMVLEDSERLLDKLWAHAMQPEFTWTQKWEVGDVIVWDNRCTMHRRDALDPDSRRLMYRTQVQGGPV